MIIKNNFIKIKEIILLKYSFLKKLSFLIKKSFFVIKKEGMISFLKKAFFFLKNVFSKKICGPIFLFFIKEKTIKDSQKKLKFFLKDKKVIVFAPWVILGGADKLIIEYTNVLKDNFNSGLITTIKSGERIDRVNIPNFDLNFNIKKWQFLPNELQEEILFSAIVQSGVKLIHIVNSELAIRVVVRFSKILKEKKIKVVSSLFALGYDKTVKKFSGYPVIYPEIIHKSDLVLSDNYYWSSVFKEIARKDFNYKKLHSPITDHGLIKKNISLDKKILWASRICDTKFIDVFYEICKQKKDIKFVIYGDIGEDTEANTFFKNILKLKNVEYRGPFEDFTDIEPSEFDLFLYTSYIDGLPNIILEISSMCIPIVSSKICGVPEALDDSELLVEKIKNQNEYIEKINNYYKNPEKYFREAALICERIKEKHTRSIFEKEYLGLIKSLLN